MLIVRVYAGGYTAAIVGHADRVVGVNDDINFIAKPGQRFVNGVIHHFKHHVVQPGTVTGVTDIHAGAFAHGLQSLQHPNTGFVVIAAVFFLCHFLFYWCCYCFVGYELNAHGHNDIAEIVASRQSDQHAAAGITKRTGNVFHVNVVEHIHKIGDIETQV